MRKERIKYYLSVEGETEKWYFDWLCKTINASPDAHYQAIIDCKVKPDPRSYVKTLTVLEPTEITHVFDRESEGEKDTKRFKNTLDKMKEAAKLKKKIKYKLGCSNLSFELWIILHKADCNGALSGCHQYRAILNRAYGESFEGVNQHKSKANFNRLLSKLTLDDVYKAIERAKLIEKNNAQVYKQEEYQKYKYYEENPSLSIHESVNTILEECINKQPKCR